MEPARGVRAATTTARTREGTRITARCRIGMLTPSSNTCLEPVTAAIAAAMPGVSVHFARFPVTRIDLRAGSRAQFRIEPMLAAAAQLADARVHAIVWNGTSGAWLGPNADRTLCRRVQEVSGVPATTSTLAQLECFRRHRITRFGLAVPYTASVTAKIVDTYAREGFRCVRAAHLGISENFAFGEVPADRIEALVRTVAVPEAEAISIVCTNFPAAPLVQRLEARTRRPVFDSTLLGMWHGLALAGAQRPVRGWGSLLAGRVRRGAQDA